MPKLIKIYLLISSSNKKTIKNKIQVEKHTRVHKKEENKKI